MRFSNLPRSAIFIVGLFFAASLMIPLPYVIEQPGPTKNVLVSTIDISRARTFPTSGKLLLTTVFVTGPSSVLFGVNVLRAWLSPDEVVLPRSLIYPPDQGSQQINAAGVAEMVGSQQSAIAAALTYMKLPVTEKSSTDKSGARTSTFIFPFPISISLKDTGGPSGGLIFALGVVEKLSPIDFVQGRVIAGTGTIEKSGHVGAIGGIQEKILAARRAGATLFLAPVENCADVMHIPSGITVYSVNTLEEAVNVLKNAKNASPHCTWQRNR